ncbi:hypothetical protein HU200_062835 [Digitaria exilis]|uniref:Retrovirus-related Pol polyprotein from transposon TNT 1-94-like beta-barrel domain-containing protein n=1 Tax=Digitaria exilis TaxID=1010633 RepID=A0A835DVK7_9POAL|nr:hypothetical protein HU200_062835 [Digitaria exilis]
MAAVPSSAAPDKSVVMEGGRSKHLLIKVDDDGGVGGFLPESKDMSYSDLAAVGFVVFSSIALVVLIACLGLFERWLQGSTTRGRLKVAVWVLTLLFLYEKIEATMALQVKVLVWWMAVATVYALRSPVMAGDPRDAAWSGARLIVDSGATNHAVGNICLLEDYQPYSTPLVSTLADGSNLRTFGIGRIQWGHFSIPNVSLVEGVQDGLISTPQLDAHHGLISCFGNGVCRIMEADGTEVGGAILEEDGSYVLRFLEVPADHGYNGKATPSDPRTCHPGKASKFHH